MNKDAPGVRVSIGALIGAMTWGLGYVLTLAFGQGMAAVDSYAVIVGWWLTAYVAAVLNVPVGSAAILALLHLIAFVFAALTNHSWFYRDVESLPAMSIFVIGGLQAVVVAAPLIFNWVLKRVLVRLFGQYFF